MERAFAKLKVRVECSNRVVLRLSLYNCLIWHGPPGHLTGHLTGHHPIGVLGALGNYGEWSLPAQSSFSAVSPEEPRRTVSECKFASSRTVLALERLESVASSCTMALPLIACQCLALVCHGARAPRLLLYLRAPEGGRLPSTPEGARGGAGVTRPPSGPGEQKRRVFIR